MKRRVLLVLAMTGAMGLLMPPVAVGGDGHGRWEIEGTWVATAMTEGVLGYGITATIARTGGNEYQFVLDYGGPPPWPGEAWRSVMVGPLWKVGPQRWAWTAICFLVGADGMPVWTLVSSGTWELLSPNEIATDDWYIGLYDPTRDAAYILSGMPPDFPPGGPWGPAAGHMYRIPHLSLAPSTD